jgi:hypothetical protein
VKWQQVLFRITEATKLVGPKIELARKRELVTPAMGDANHRR